MIAAANSKVAPIQFLHPTADGMHLASVAKIVGICFIGIGTAGISSPYVFMQAYSNTNNSPIYIAHNHANTLPQENAEKVQLIRDYFKVSITELAKIFEVSRQAIYEWMDGRSLSQENEEKLDRLFSAIAILNDDRLELSPQILRRKVDGEISIGEAIKTDKDVLALARSLKETLITETEQRRLISNKMLGTKSAPLDLGTYGAPHLNEDA